MKKLFISALSLVLIMVSMSIAAHAEEELYYWQTEDGIFEYCYSVNEDNTATIWGIGFSDGSKTPNPYIIPDAIEGHTVTVISGTLVDDWNMISVFENGENGSGKHEPYFYGAWHWDDTIIIIPESVHTIGDYTFSFIDARIVVPGSVRTIGEKAFYGCEKLIGSDLNLENLTHLGSNAFEKCTALKSIQLPDTLASIGDNPFSRCESLGIIEISAQHPYLAYQDGVLFEKATKRLVTYLSSNANEEYSIPDGILEIGAYAFCDSIHLTLLNIPDSVTAIGANAFISYNSKQVSRVIEVPASVIEIGETAFYGKNTLIVEKDSYAHTYAIENNRPYQLSNTNSDMSWLGN